MARNECVWCRDGSCYRKGRVRRCKPSDESWFNFAKPVQQLWIDQMCEFQNPLNNEVLYITEDDIQALKSGKILAYHGEIFIALKEE